MACPVEQTQAFQVLHCHLMTFLAPYTLVEERQFHILHGRFETNQIETLEDKTDHPVAVFCGTRLTQIFDERTRQPVFAFVVVVQNAQNIQQR